MLMCFASLMFCGNGWDNRFDLQVFVWGAGMFWVGMFLGLMFWIECYWAWCFGKKGPKK